MLLDIKKYNWGANPHVQELLHSEIPSYKCRWTKYNLNSALQVSNFQRHFCHVVAAFGWIPHSLLHAQVWTNKVRSSNFKSASPLNLSLNSSMSSVGLGNTQSILFGVLHKLLLKHTYGWTGSALKAIFSSCLILLLGWECCSLL